MHNIGNLSTKSWLNYFLTWFSDGNGTKMSWEIVVRSLVNSKSKVPKLMYDGTYHKFISVHLFTVKPWFSQLTWFRWKRRLPEIAVKIVKNTGDTFSIFWAHTLFTRFQRNSSFCSWYSLSGSSDHWLGPRCVRCLLLYLLFCPLFEY